MGLKNGCFATLWENKDTHNVLEVKEKFAEGFITISKKNKTTDKYETDFAGKIRFLGKAFNIIKEFDLIDRSRIKLLEVEVNQTQKDGKNYNNYICWDCELPDGDSSENSDKKAKETKAQTNKLEPIDIIDDDLPF